MTQPTHPDDTTRDEHRCARTTHCTNPELLTDGTRRPALTYRPFCDADRRLIEGSLTALPGLYVDLVGMLGERRRGDGPRVSGSRLSPPLPINVEVDALLREVVWVVASWDERVRLVARLSGPDTEASRHRRDDLAVTRMVRMLSGHLDALLALPAEPMARTTTLEEAAKHALAGRLGVVHVGAGWAEVLLDLSGADAGLEVLALERRCLRVLGWTPQHEDLPVACWDCGLRTLRRRDGAAGLEDRASCSGCRAVYEGERYTLLMGEVYEQRTARGKVAS